jgi:hypothetical protein
MNLQWYDWVGILGTLMVLAAFFLLQAGKIHGNRLAYQLLNLLGAVGVLLSLQGKFNIAVFMLEAVWVAISIYGIVRTLSKGPQASV